MQTYNEDIPAVHYWDMDTGYRGKIRSVERIMADDLLGDFVGAPLTKIRTVEQMMAERLLREHGDAASDVPPEIAEQVVHQFGPAIS